MENKKKLLIATDNFLPRWDGISRFLSEIIPRIKSDFDITLIAPNFEGTYVNKDKIKIIRVPIHNFSIGDFKLAKRPNKNILREAIKEADIVFTQTIGPIGERTILEAKKQKKHIVGFNHSVEWELVPNAIDSHFLKKIIHMLTIRKAKKLYNLFDLLISPSEEIKEKLTWYKFKPKKEVVYLGVDTKKFRPPRVKNDAKRKLGINPEFKVITYVGRLGREKDLKTLFRAYIRLKKDYEKLKLLIVGDGVKEIKDMFSERTDVIVMGNQDNVVPFLQASDIYVLPSLTETTSLSTLEAMACGVVPVATHVGLVKKYIRHENNGMLFKKRNVYMLTKRLEKLINNPEFTKKLSIDAVKTVKENFDWDDTGKKIKDLLLNL